MDEDEELNRAMEQMRIACAQCADAMKRFSSCVTVLSMTISECIDSHRGPAPAVSEMAECALARAARVP